MRHEAPEVRLRGRRGARLALRCQREARLAVRVELGAVFGGKCKAHWADLHARSRPCCQRADRRRLPAVAPPRAASLSLCGAAHRQRRGSTARRLAECYFLPHWPPSGAAPCRRDRAARRGRRRGRRRRGRVRLIAATSRGTAGALALPDRFVRTSGPVVHSFRSWILLADGLHFKRAHAQLQAPQLAASQLVAEQGVAALLAAADLGHVRKHRLEARLWAWDASAHGDAPSLLPAGWGEWVHEPAAAVGCAARG